MASPAQLQGVALGHSRTLPAHHPQHSFARQSPTSPTQRAALHQSHRPHECPGRKLPCRMESPASRCRAVHHAHDHRASWRRRPLPPLADQDLRALANGRKAPPGCLIRMAGYSSGCGCRSSCSGGGRRRRWEKSAHGSRSVFCSATAGASTPMEMRLLAGCSELRRNPRRAAASDRLCWKNELGAIIVRAVVRGGRHA
jgi:hypothetical protein